MIARAPLVPRDDPTTLFTGSGMQPLLPYLLGAHHPAGVRLADSQPCLRVQDVDEVGDSRHTTFFEMLGNWSLGDYFKREQLTGFWQFLTQRIGLDPARIYVSCFSGDEASGIPKDTESAGIWTALFRDAGLDADQVDLGTVENAYLQGTGGARIAFYNNKNWWCRGGTVDTMPPGEPGGPDSEAFYLYPQVAHDPSFGAHCHHNCDCGRFIELGNSVFLQYVKTQDAFEPLPRRNVDYGGGLERIAAAAIDSPDVYRVSLLWPIVAQLEQLSGLSYDTHTTAMRVIADHVRGATFLAVDGVLPRNKEQGYVLRRLLRRAIRYALDLGLEEDFVARVVPVVGDLYRDDYPGVAERCDQVISVLDREERAFAKTLRKGLARLSRFGGATITGAELFTLYDTYGFPVELSTEEAVRLGISMSGSWRAEFDAKMAEQRRRSQTASKLHVGG